MLNRKKIISLLFLCLLVGGCAWFKKEKSDAPVTQRHDESNKIIDAARLKQGGTIFIVPFKAGPNVAATPQLDRIALMIVKGMAEQINQSQSPFRVLSAENKDYADFIIQGHITKLTEPQGLKKWPLGKKEKILAAMGYMIEQKTRKKILIFSQQKRSLSKGQGYEDLGLGIGSDLAESILEAQRSH